VKQLAVSEENEQTVCHRDEDEATECSSRANERPEATECSPKANERPESGDLDQVKDLDGMKVLNQTKDINIPMESTIETNGVRTIDNVTAEASDEAANNEDAVEETVTENRVEDEERKHRIRTAVSLSAGCNESHPPTVMDELLDHLPQKCLSENILLADWSGSPSRDNSGFWTSSVCSELPSSTRCRSPPSVNEAPILEESLTDIVGFCHGNPMYHDHDHDQTTLFDDSRFSSLFSPRQPRQ